jgi:hypothetical protein
MIARFIICISILFGSYIWLLEKTETWPFAGVAVIMFFVALYLRSFWVFWWGLFIAVILPLAYLFDLLDKTPIHIDGYPL